MPKTQWTDRLRYPKGLTDEWEKMEAEFRRQKELAYLRQREEEWAKVRLFLKEILQMGPASTDAVLKLMWAIEDAALEGNLGVEAVEELISLWDQSSLI